MERSKSLKLFHLMSHYQMLTVLPSELNILVTSPLEQFETINLVSLVAPIIGSFVLSLTNVGFYALLVLGLGIGYHVLSINHLVVPSN